MFQRINGMRTIEFGTPDAPISFSCDEFYGSVTNNATS
ncbi:MAG: hypothetical protein RI898_1345 [Actinomycetota bacterium]